MLDEVPDVFLRELNGGIVVVDEAKPHGPELPDVYVLGEYVEDPYGLGRMIVLYYGSFEALYGDEPEEELGAELWETILHELRHHVERLAGVDDLDREDEEELAAFREWEAARRGDAPESGTSDVRGMEAEAGGSPGGAQGDVNEDEPPDEPSRR